MENQVDVKRVQYTLLDMAKRIAEILEKHDIPYMIAFGTLLGAVRHKGFIPWDDDFDFYLFDDSYDLALSSLSKELPVGMFLENEESEPLYYHGWSHVKDLNSRCFCNQFPQDNCYSHKGICVDLFRTKKMKKSTVENFLNGENASYLLRRKKLGLISSEDYNARMIRLNENIEAIKNIKIDCDFDVFNLVPHYSCHYMKAVSVFPLKKYQFEDTLFWGPNDADDILTSIYGDYLKLPPIQNQVCHYSSVVFL